jgi:hypothetical protein
MCMGDCRQGLDLLDTYRLVTTVLSLIYTLYSSLQHTLSLLSLMCLHQSHLVMASNGRRSTYSGFPNYPCASATTI